MTSTTFNTSSGDWRSEWKAFAWLTALFLGFFLIPAEALRIDAAVAEAIHLAAWYAREHVLLCLIPAFFIAGAVSVFLSRGAVMKYLGPSAPRPVAYGVDTERSWEVNFIPAK